MLPLQSASALLRALVDASLIGSHSNVNPQEAYLLLHSYYYTSFIKKFQKCEYVGDGEVLP